MPLSAALASKALATVSGTSFASWCFATRSGRASQRPLACCVATCGNGTVRLAGCYGIMRRLAAPAGHCRLRGATRQVQQTNGCRYAAPHSGCHCFLLAWLPQQRCTGACGTHGASRARSSRPPRASHLCNEFLDGGLGERLLRLTGCCSSGRAKLTDNTINQRVQVVGAVMDHPQRSTFHLFWKLRAARCRRTQQKLMARRASH